MENLALNERVIAGKVYMVEMQSGDVESYRVISETPTHFILSFSINDSVEVFPKAKKEIIGIYEVKEWLETQEKM